MPILIIQNKIENIHADMIVRAENGKHRRFAAKRCRIQQASNENSRYVAEISFTLSKRNDFTETERLSLLHSKILKEAKDTGCRSVAFYLPDYQNTIYSEADTLKIIMNTLGPWSRRNEMMIYIICDSAAAVSLPWRSAKCIADYMDSSDGITVHDLEISDDEMFAYQNEDEDLSSVLYSVCAEDKNDETESDGDDVDQDVIFDFGETWDESDIVCEDGKTDGEDESMQEAYSEEPADGFQDWLNNELQSGVSSAVGGGKRSLESLISEMEDTFPVALMKLIDRNGMKDSDVYKKVHMDRRVFSKLKSPKYRPSKVNIIMVAIALELNLDETLDLLRKAGYSLARNNLFDVIIIYCLENGIYDTWSIDEILVNHDQKSLWCEE